MFLFFNVISVLPADQPSCRKVVKPEGGLLVGRIDEMCVIWPLKAQLYSNHNFDVSHMGDHEI